MPSDLLDSQFESLEEPDNCEMYSVIKVAVDQTVEEIINEILRALKAKYGIRVSIHSTVWNVASWNLYFSYLHIGVCEIRPQVTLDLISNSSSYLQGQTKQIERRID